MRNIGFSTGALALADFRKGIAVLRGLGVTAIELSALRENEVDPLVDAYGSLELPGFDYVSVHAPSSYARENEDAIARKMRVFANKQWYVVIHPDAIYNYDKWRCLGRFLCVENMDKRKPQGRTLHELRNVFSNLPDASFCFDIGHVRQVDPTMSEAYKMLSEYTDRLVQVHMSEVNSQSKHDTISYGSLLAFRKVQSVIRENVPIIMETDISRTEKGLPEKALCEIEKARRIFSKSQFPIVKVNRSRFGRVRFSLRSFFGQVLHLLKLAQ